MPVDISVMFAHRIQTQMRDIGMLRADLARKLGVSRPAVTQLLSGANLTLESMVKLSDAVGLEMHIKLKERIL